MTRMRIGWVLAVVAAVMVPLMAPLSPVMAQDGMSSLTGSPGPGVPYLIDPVLPAPSVRFQNHFVPISVNPPAGVAGETQDNFLWPFRFHGVWMFSDKVVGEASLPFVASFLGGDADNGFDVGNPRLGFEFPVVAEGDRHRLAVAIDLYLPLAQIGLDDQTPENLADAAQRRARHTLTAAALPTLAPDYLAELLTPSLGLHYRLRQNKVVAHVVLDLPIFMGFDLNQDILFHEVWAGLRYALEVAYEARPVFPSLEFAGLTTFSHDDPSALPGQPRAHIDTTTAVLGTLGIRAAFDRYEPGLAITFPFTLDNDALDTIIYVHLDLAYRFE